MGKTLTIRELAVVVVGKNHNPTILNPYFLKVNKIVPADWELVRPPICADIVAQVAYKNGVTVIAQPDKIIFSEPFALDAPMEVESPGIAHRYLEMLPHVDYLTVGINPKAHVVFDSSESAEKYLAERFLLKGPWLEFGDAAPRSGIKLIYTLEKVKFHLAIETATLKSDGTGTPVMLFSANFHHELVGDTTKERHSSALETVDSWKSDMETFQHLISERILS